MLFILKLKFIAHTSSHTHRSYSFCYSLYSLETNKYGYFTLGRAGLVVVYWAVKAWPQQDLKQGLNELIPMESPTVRRRRN